MLANSAAGTGLLGRFLGHGESWLYEDFVGDSTRPGSGTPLEALESILHGLKSSPENVDAGAIGYISYDWGCRRFGLQGPREEKNAWMLPDIQFLIFKSLTHPQALQTKSRTQATRTFTRSELDALVRGQFVSVSVSKARYLADVGQIKEHIANGDIYQANYTQAFDVRTDLTSEENADLLSSRLQAPYSAFLRFGPGTIAQPDGGRLSFPEMSIITVSPERFWRLRSGIIDSRPIKGTIGRADTGSLDRELRRRLLTSRKDRAELLMITDLVRNDLGQVADIGSVKTEALVRIRPTPTVWHLESTLNARLANSRSWVDVMKALLPAGSISGTPKKRALQILDSLEPVRRGPYCGAIGWIDANGDADFAVGIRTCVQVGNTIRIHGGGGIVADSDPESEYYESVLKVASLLKLLAPAQSSARPQNAQSTMESNA